MFDADFWQIAKPIATVALLAVLWTWESVAPAMAAPGRFSHALRNLSLALLNTLLLGLASSVALVAVAAWTTEQRFGLLYQFDLSAWLRLLVALVLLDLWLYLWHRANHTIPLLWRFHRAHHADEALDVTTATRFHPGELLVSAGLRLLLVPLLGLELHELLIHDTLVVLATQFHHADLSLGRADRWLRCLVVTPGMHAVHHSMRREECDSNFGVILSVWDRLAGSFQVTEGRIVFGVPGFMSERWRSLFAILRLPFTPLTVPPAPARPRDRASSISTLGSGSRPRVRG